MFDGQVALSYRINLIYDGAHYHVITNLTAAMAKRSVCLACNKGCEKGALHWWGASCDAYSPIPPCIPDYTGIPCDEWNIYFRNAACFENHRRLHIYRSILCARPRFGVASVVLWKEGITIATGGSLHIAWRTGSWGTGVTCLLFPTGPLVAIEYCTCFRF